MAKIAIKENETVKKTKIIEEIDRRLSILLPKLEHLEHAGLECEYDRGKFNAYKNIKNWLLWGD